MKKVKEILKNKIVQKVSVVLLIVFTFLIVDYCHGYALEARINWNVYLPSYVQPEIVFREGFSEFEDLMVYRLNENQKTRTIKYNNMIEIDENSIQDVKEKLDRVYDSLSLEEQKFAAEKYFTKKFQDFDYYLFVEQKKEYENADLLLILVDSKNNELCYFDYTW